MSSTQTFLDAIANRRTIYDLKQELPAGVKIEDVQHVIQTIVKNTPTALNSQENRAIILTGEAHRQVWDRVLKSITSKDGRKRPTSVRDEASLRFCHLLHR